MTISFWEELGLPLSREPLLSQVKSNLISLLEYDFLSSFVTNLLMFLHPFLNGFLNLHMQVFDHLSFYFPILVSPCLMSVEGKKIQGSKGIEPINNLKRGVGSSGVHHPIVCKLNVRKRFLPLSIVLDDHASQHLAITLRVISCRKDMFGSKPPPQCSPKGAKELDIPITHNSSRDAM